MSGLDLAAALASPSGVCLIDGARAGNAQDLPLEELVDAARRVVTSELHAKGWKHWATSMDRAFAHSHDRDQSAETVGQTLELMRRTGPSVWRDAPELEALAASLARFWPQTPQPGAGT